MYGDLPLPYNLNRLCDTMAMKDNPEGRLAQSIQLNATAFFGTSVQLPMFDKAEPDACFMLAKANFNLRNVTDSRTKYWYVLSKFDATMLRKLSTFLKLPRGSDPYQELCEKLCQTYELPLEQKIDALLGMTDIGDERPAEFGLELQRLASNALMDDMLKQVFLRCLPKAIVTAIMGSLGEKFETVVKAADRAWTAAATATSGNLLSSASVAAVSSGPAFSG